MSAPEKNRNAAKGDANAEAHLHLRVQPAEKNTWLHATQARAQRDPAVGTKLADWVRDTLNQAAARELR